MWNPKASRLFATHAAVTVSQTASLVNEMVHVSWTGFTPSSDLLYDQTSTDYPVMVAECKTARPLHLGQCYGANNGGVEGAFGPFGPMNTAYATTSRNGTGQLDIQILTQAENQFLGCTNTHECSLVIVPSQGGDTLDSPVRCGNHSLDTQGTAFGEFAFSSQTGQCSWKQRIVVPLRFAPAPTNCAIKKADFTAIGSPMLSRAMDQWRAGLCAAPSNPLTITYNSSLTEPAAIADLPAGLGDIALTTRPGPNVAIGGKTYTYAPIAISAVAIAYWVDNPSTGKPVTSLKLDPRLIAKLITQSYNFENEGCGAGKPHKIIGCDGAVDGNPFSLFDDPEFKKLNPKLKAPFGGGAALQIPTVESGHSDMTWEVTRWIATNQAGDAFMAGQFDPWGTHVNTDYLGLKYPLDSFTGQDSYPVIAHQYSPVFPLSLVAGYQAQNWQPGTDWEKDQFGNFPRDPIEVPGERALFAILDEADAAAFRFPTARLLNDKGRYVAPTDRSMAAALPSMFTSKANKITQQVDFATQKAGAYPLTMVIYAMVPTSGEKPAKAAAIARFLGYVAGAGQKPGAGPGELAPGYLPLPASLRAETVRAAGEVAAQHGNGTSSNTSPGASPSPSPGSASLPPPASPSPSPLGAGVVTVALKRPQTSGLIRYALPVLLIVGGAATLGGAASFVAGGGGITIAARLRRLRAPRTTLRRRP
jgi:ABC-type phosphate transport system substrate-binding protein